MERDRERQREAYIEREGSDRKREKGREVEIEGR